MSLSLKLTLILPTLNERDNIVPQIEEVLKALPEIGQIIVVDDNSKDGTLKAVHEGFPQEIKNGKVKTIHRKANFGLTPSLKDGIEASKTDLVGWMDCDLSMPANLLPQMLEQLTGPRYLYRIPFYRGRRTKRFKPNRKRFQAGDYRLFVF